MVLLQTGLLAGSGGVACVEEHAPEIWVLVKPKVHDTLLPTGLLAGSGGVAGVEEHAPDSLPTRAKSESKVHGTPANRATCWKRWCCLCGGTCTGDLGQALIIVARLFVCVRLDMLTDSRRTERT
jgi:hypothetical protein